MEKCYITFRSVTYAQRGERVLQGAGIRCTLGSALETSAAALELLAQCDGVVLVETCGRSRYDRVLWQLETAKDYGKELLGCVVIGG